MPQVLEQLAEINYRPLSPRSYSPNIGMIGCGGITRDHLQAYKAAGFRITALCDLEIAKAESRRVNIFRRPRSTKTTANSWPMIRSKWSISRRIRPSDRHSLPQLCGPANMC